MPRCGWSSPAAARSPARPKTAATRRCRTAPAAGWPRPRPAACHDPPQAHARLLVSNTWTPQVSARGAKPGGETEMPDLELVDVALGRSPADLVIRAVSLVDRRGKDGGQAAAADDQVGGRPSQCDVHQLE